VKHIRNMPDVLFDTVERYHAEKSWGRVLDAGTGLSSVKWMMRLASCTGWTAITADEQMKNTIMSDSSVSLRETDKLVVGNWMDNEFCATLGMYDTIVADYLIGAIDGFSPYSQDLIVKKLKEHLTPGGRLYIIGMYPIPDHAQGEAEIITEVRRVRDACILMAGHRPYREYPSEWVIRHLEGEGLRVFKSKIFTILHSEDSLLRQLRVARSKLELMPQASLRMAMDSYLTDIEERVTEAISQQAKGNIPLSHDYVIAAELPES
jgi:hypothetical protein